MRTCYVISAVRGIADLVMPGELTPYWTITRINVPQHPVNHRRQGYGQKLLDMILDDADEEGLVLMVEPSPSDGPNYEQLVVWYRKNGFAMTSIGYMLRLPGASRSKISTG